MKMTFHVANCIGKAANCVYTKKVIVESAEAMNAVTRLDHVCATYKDNRRGNDNFIESDVIPMDIDNDHSEKPEDWLTEEKLDALFPDVDYVLVPSRHHMLPKDGKAARPRYHLYFPIATCMDAKKYAAIKAAIHRKFSFFDGNALDAARFLYGSETGKAVFHEGWVTVMDGLNVVEPAAEIPFTSSITEGSRNNTMSHFAGRVLKKYGDTEAAMKAFAERAEKCEPPLSQDELNAIWNSAVKFYKKKVVNSDDYVSPEKYNEDFGTSRLKPEDYSDLGEAKVIAKHTGDFLKFTSATDFIIFQKNRWYEDKEKALGAVEDFMDHQLHDAEEAVHVAEDAIAALGISRVEIKTRSKNLEKMVPGDRISLLYDLLAADGYKKHVMKYRNYKNIVNAQNASKPMVAIDVAELDYDPELLNTPTGTYDLSKGMEGMHPHDPDDLITKITACSPGDKGQKLWEDSLQLFFCKDQELIDYVQEIVGMAAIGKVYAEHMIIAYGGGANGKSTFWNTVARVLGNYSGKISAEALTMNCKRNVKPEMAELKGKRLIIASELEEGTRLNTGMVKQLCSVDPIEAEKKYKDPFHFDPSHTLVLYTNHLPKVSANDDGTWRRLIVIPFNAKIKGQSDIKNYGDYLFENAGPAILNWVIKGAEKAISKGFKFTKPKVVVDAVEAYREENDWLGHFLDDYCDIDSSYEEKSGELYQCYHSMCLRTGEYPRSTSDFYGCLEKLGYERRKRNYGRVILGLRLKEGQDFINA